MTPSADTRLYAILARDAARAVVFRRGPSKRVLLIAWNTDEDTFQEGQWLKGRIYERRCDLSPDGELLLYFAASYKKPYYSWSAVSRPPFLTAIALWPKGDAWGGGGHFASNTEILLNHRQPEMALAPEFHVPDRIRVSPLGEHAGLGEDNPIWARRLERDGWILTSAGRYDERKRGETVWIRFDPPPIWEKSHPRFPHVVLRMWIKGLKETDGPWYLTEHEVVDGRSGRTAILERSDWADWSAEGDLLYAQGGRLYRCRREANELAIPLMPALLADFSARTFEERVAPSEVLRWPPPRTRRRSGSSQEG